MNDVANKNEYIKILLGIARAQKRLLSYSMDWKQRVAVHPPQIERTGFLGLKKSIPSAYCEKEALLSELEGLQGRARQIATNQNGYYWWDTPWKQVEQSLLFDLVENEQKGEWRFEHKWDKIQTENSHCLFFLEEGHCSSFNNSYDLEFYETSCYSAAERSDMMQRYSEKIKQQELNASIMLDGHMVRSQESGKLYDSIDDYLLSTEHYLNKDYHKTAYKNSLSTQHQRNTVRVSSNSLHYHSIYYTAEYLVSTTGCLVAWNLHPYTLVKSTGDLPKDFVELRQQKDAAVSSAAFLADQTEITAVPCSLFGECVVEPFTDLSDAIRYAGLITCMAEKLYFDEE